jgi:hypothetical protein
MFVLKVLNADDDFCIPNVLPISGLKSWALSIHTATAGIAMDHPIRFGVEEGVDHLVRFVGFYRAKASGAAHGHLSLHAGSELVPGPALPLCPVTTAVQLHWIGHLLAFKWVAEPVYLTVAFPPCEEC